MTTGVRNYEEILQKLFYHSLLKEIILLKFPLVEYYPIGSSSFIITKILKFV